eukprot:6935347-Pyramimonas_sp.AAC.1
MCIRDSPRAISCPAARRDTRSTTTASRPSPCAKRARPRPRSRRPWAGRRGSCRPGGARSPM